MPYKPRELENMLLIKYGFEPDKESSDDHRRYVLKLEGLPPIQTHFSHGKKEIGDSLESLIAKQVRVRTKYFREMFSCKHDRATYYEQVRIDPFPPFKP